MCYFEQTQYLACGHNVEVVTEKCELGERYRTSMHDKIITAIHTNDGQCEKCNPTPAYEESTNGITADLPDVATSSIPDLSGSNPAETSSHATSDTTAESRHSRDVPSNIKYPLVDLTDDSRPEPKRKWRERRDSMGEDLMDVN